VYSTVHQQLICFVLWCCVSTYSMSNPLLVYQKILSKKVLPPCASVKYWYAHQNSSPHIFWIRKALALLVLFFLPNGWYSDIGVVNWDIIFLKPYYALQYYRIMDQSDCFFSFFVCEKDFTHWTSHPIIIVAPGLSTPIIVVESKR